VIRIRYASAVLIGVALLTLAACGGNDTPTAGSAPSAPATTSAAPTPPASTGATAAASADAKLCETANKIGAAMKTELLKAVKDDGTLDVAQAKKTLTGLADQLNAAAVDNDGQVAAAMKDFAAQSAKAATAADPTTAVSGPAYEKAGSDLTAACKAVGVSVNY
jgi:hypothetical protein